tara:strand:- start:247 stop:1626 length:1380 start_codon:yes stop_codon:yes gene_type:complete
MLSTTLLFLVLAFSATATRTTLAYSASIGNGGLIDDDVQRWFAKVERLRAEGKLPSLEQRLAWNKLPIPGDPSRGGDDSSRGKYSSGSRSVDSHSYGSDGGSDDSRDSSTGWTRHCIAAHELDPKWEDPSDYFDFRCRKLNSMLHSAISEGDMDQVLVALNLGAGLDDMLPPHDPTQTPLGAAASWGEPLVAKFFVEAGANCTHVGTDGFTPLDVAAFKGQDEVMSLLLEHELPCCEMGRDGFLPIHRVAFAEADPVGDWAAQRLRTAEHLLMAGANPDAKSSKGHTPMSLASMQKNRPMVELLAKYRAKRSMVWLRGLVKEYQERERERKSGSGAAFEPLSEQEATEVVLKRLYRRAWHDGGEHDLVPQLEALMGQVGMQVPARPGGWPTKGEEEEKEEEDAAATEERKELKEERAQKTMTKKKKEMEKKTTMKKKKRIKRAKRSKSKNKYENKKDGL